MVRSKLITAGTWERDTASLFICSHYVFSFGQRMTCQLVFVAWVEDTLLANQEFLARTKIGTWTMLNTESGSTFNVSFSTRWWNTINRLVSIKASNSSQIEYQEKATWEVSVTLPFERWDNVIVLQKKIHSNNILFKNISPSSKVLSVLRRVKIIRSLHKDKNNHTLRINSGMSVLQITSGDKACALNFPKKNNSF